MYRSFRGSGGFGAPVEFAAGLNTRSVAVGDFNGDARLDLVVVNAFSDNVSLLLGNGSGGFAAPTSFPVGDEPVGVAAGDFNGDARTDLAVVNSVSDTVSVLFNVGTGAFTAPVNYATGDRPTSVAVGDFDGDSDLDLAVTNSNADTVSVLVNGAAGVFSPQTTFATGIPNSFGGVPADGPTSVVVGDFDGDAILDLAVTNFMSDTLSVLFGDGAGVFAAPANFATSHQPHSVAMGDFDGDADPDLAVANALYTVNILLNTTQGTGNVAPVAVNDSFSTSKDSALTVPAPGLLGNDTDADGGSSLTAIKVTGPAHGIVTMNADGSFTYTPASNFTGGDSFTYKANDGTADSNVATVTLTVNAAPAPQADVSVTMSNIPPPW